MQPLKIAHIGHNDQKGGAARAMYRIHQAVQKNMDSQLYVSVKHSDDPSVHRVPGKPAQAWQMLRPHTTIPLKKLQRQKAQALQSLNVLPSRIAERATANNPDIVNLHWVCAETLRLEQLRKIRQPLVWTCHDLWPLSGSLHYPEDNFSSKLDSWVRERKEKIYPHLNLTFCCPSPWVKECLANNAFTADKPATVVPYPIDSTIFKPIDQLLARQILNLPSDKKLLAFGADAGILKAKDPRKGMDVLLAMLEKQKRDNLELVLFGMGHYDAPLPFKAHFMGTLHDDATLALMYSAADVMAVPSTMETFGQTASEAMACGTPVLTFNRSGLKYVVDHQINGYLAEDAEDLGKGLDFILDNLEKLSDAARQKVLKSFDSPVVAKLYENFYQEVYDRR